MKNLYEESQLYQSEWTENRRYLHAHAETGFDLPNTVAFIEKKLRKLGYEPKTACGSVYATVGKGESSFLLRADMDALPVREQTKLPFAAKNGNMHACGHDMHAAMLLGAAKLLKMHEKELKGRVVLLFQAAEEKLEGARELLQSGCLEEYGLRGAMTVHVTSALPLPTGSVVTVDEGVHAPAADFFRIELQGRGCHGSTPWEGVDSATMGARILLALQEITSRELPVSTPAVLTVGSFQAGRASNVIADKGTLSGTLRSFDEGAREKVKRRIEEISKGIAKSFGGRAKVCFEGGCPTLYIDGALSKIVRKSALSLFGEGAVLTPQTMGKSAQNRSGGSEDFAYFSQKMPAVTAAIAAGECGKGYDYPLHHPKAKFDEGALPVGAALLSQVALDFWAQG